jgi:hypothetical protein
MDQTAIAVPGAVYLTVDDLPELTPEQVVTLPDEKKVGADVVEGARRRLVVESLPQDGLIGTKVVAYLLGVKQQSLLAQHTKANAERRAAAAEDREPPAGLLPPTTRKFGKQIVWQIGPFRTWMLKERTKSRWQTKGSLKATPEGLEWLLSDEAPALLDRFQVARVLGVRPDTAYRMMVPPSNPKQGVTKRLPSETVGRARVVPRQVLRELVGHPDR